MTDRDPPTPEIIEAAARAMCERDGFSWDAETIHETANGEDPEQQREYWRDKAETALSAALSVPAAAVVGEPVARPTYQQVKDTVQANINRMHQAGESHLMMARWLSADLDKLYPAPCPETIQTYYERQIEWSRETFGPALRTKGVLDHIRKELGEIEQEPHDLSEWVDVVILAMDGFWRHGGKAADLLPALLAKQKKNMARTWPDWRTMGEDRAIEHDRSKDAALGGASHE